jgi:frataxin
MAQIPLARGASRVARRIRVSSARSNTVGLVRSLAVRPYTPVTYRAASLPTSRFLSTTRPSLKGLSPETDNPQPKEAEPQNLASAPADLTMDEYHKLSDQYLEKLVDKFEALQEQKDEIDCEYSV